MRVLSKSFERLKLMLPWVPADTKLSKLDTLRLAMTYINHLHNMLVESEQETEVSKISKHLCIYEKKGNHPKKSLPLNINYLITKKSIFSGDGSECEQ